MASSARLRLADTPAAGPAFPPPSRDARPVDRAAWIRAFRHVRDETERRAAPLSPEDQTVQSMADASPTKWHRAHTTWFFEQFLLGARAGYAPYDPRYAFLFNSYYVQAGPRHARDHRGLITRPTAAEVGEYRAHVDHEVATLVERVAEAELPGIVAILEIGLNHEQQHQELILTDILHAFGSSPIRPAYDPAWHAPRPAAGEGEGVGEVALVGGIAPIGFTGEGFAFDNEFPRHEALIPAVGVARGLVTNAEWLAFMADGGYADAALWLSDGWVAAQRDGWDAPGYWEQRDGAWSIMTLGGLRPVDPALPVTHVSYYEADAFARWAGRDLPTEFEWETAAATGELAGAQGCVWQWTRSSYGAYPGYRAAPGALGEYNGKFMANQYVLRGSSVATPQGHARPTYRNFFYPHQRWQFTGLRLSRYAR